MTLVDALHHVELKPGRTYRCQVRGMSVELRVADQAVETPVPESELTADVPETVAVNLPSPPARWLVTAAPGPAPMPRRFEIPPDGETPE